MDWPWHKLSVPDRIGIGGFVLAFLSLFWQVVTHIRDRRQVLRVRIFFENTLVVRMQNLGRVPVYVSEASVTVAGKKIGLRLLVATSEPVEPGEERIAWLYDTDSLAGVSPDELQQPFVLVRTGRGDEHRIDGAEVETMLRDIIHREQSRPTTPQQSFDPNAWINRYRNKW